MTDANPTESTDAKAKTLGVDCQITTAHVHCCKAETLDTQTKCRPTPCDRHLCEHLKLYCLVCKEALCFVCYVTQHNGHRSAEIVEVAGESRKQIERGISELENSIQKTQKNLEKLQDKRENVAKQFEKLETDVDAQAEKMKAEIEDHRQKLQAELIAKRTKQFEEIDQCINHVTQSKGSIDSLVTESTELLKSGSNVDVVRKSRDLKLKTAELTRACEKDQTKQLSDVVVTFKPSEILSKYEGNVVGSFMSVLYSGHTSAQSPLDSTQTWSLNSRSNLNAVRLFNGQLYVAPNRDKHIAVDGRTSARGTFGPTLTLSLNGGSNVNAVCSFDGQLYVTRYRNKQIAVYDTSMLTLQRKIPINGAGNKLSGLAVCSTSNCLYVSDWDKDQVYVVGLSDTDSPSLKTWSVDSGPRGLSVNKRHNLLVAHGIAKKLQEYTPDGALVRTISLGNCLWHAVELSSGITVLSQYGPCFGVSLMSVDGKILKRYDSTMNESAPAKTKYPRSLAVDSKGFIMVADRCTNRILVLNPKLTEVHQLPLHTPLESPTALDYDEPRGRLYVGEFTGQYRVLVFDNIFNLSSLF